MNAQYGCDGFRAALDNNPGAEPAMTKAEQARRMAWRFKVLQQAYERSRNVAWTCRYVGLSRQAYNRGGGGTRRTGRHLFDVGQERRIVDVAVEYEDHDLIMAEYDAALRGRGEETLDRWLN